LQIAPYAGATLGRSNAVAIFVRHVTNDRRVKGSDEALPRSAERLDAARAAAGRFRNTDAMTEIRMTESRNRAAFAVAFPADFGDYEARR